MLSEKLCSAIQVMALALFLLADGLIVQAQDSAENRSPQLLMHTIPLSRQQVPIYINDRMIGYKTSYFGTIHVTERKDPYNVVFDTGSGHIILPSVTCRAEACLKHRQYDRSRSATAALVTETDSIKPWASIVITFGTGKVKGELLNDVVCLDQEGTRCTNINLVTATNMSDNPFKSFEFDGIFGLGLQALSLNRQFNFLEGMASTNLAFMPKFAVFLASYSDEQSSITFGGYDKSKAATEMSWAPVARSEMGYWQVQLDNVRVGNTKLDFCADGGCYAILDTGSSMLGVPGTEIKTLHRLLSREVPQSLLNDKIDCRNVSGADLTFDVGNFQVVLGVEDLAKPDPVNMTQPASESALSEETQLFCRHLLLPVNLKEPIGPKVFIWGEPVLRKYYSVFDVERKMVGMALASHSGRGAVPLEFR